jgi:hypothetical protein
VTEKTLIHLGSNASQISEFLLFGILACFAPIGALFHERPVVTMGLLPICF